MIQDDFNFTLDSSDFPVSIEEFAAYLDGNLSDDEMQRVSSVIDNDEMMQGVMDSMEQSELTLAEYGQEDMQLSEEMCREMFHMPIIKKDGSNYIENLESFARVAAFAPMEDGPEKKQNSQRMPPQVLDGNNDDNKME